MIKYSRGYYQEFYLNGVKWFKYWDYTVKPLMIQVCKDKSFL